MATMEAILGGLKILAKYVKPDDHCIAAQHDIIYAGPGGGGHTRSAPWITRG